MAVSQLSPVYDEFLDFLLEKATPQEILSYHASEKAQERAIELLEKGNFDKLTPEELAELEQMRNIDQFVSVLKARALEALSKL